jgi:hypothetical protein
LRTVVVSQPMYFPWVGMFEQLRLADIFVHYDDAQFVRPSFFNRVQVRTQQGIRWMTVPVRAAPLGTPICDICIDEKRNWRREHRQLLSCEYAKAPCLREMLTLYDEVVSSTTKKLSELSIKSVETVASYFGMRERMSFLLSSQLDVSGQSTERLLQILEKVDATCYVTGHGAKNYLDHNLVESNEIEILYMDYQKREYLQLHGQFTPFVTILDLIANLGKQGIEFICSGTIPWRKMLNSPR